MFDYRYHALSLVAVFLALLIGLLLGVAIGDQGLVSSAERNVRKSLRGDVNRARADAAKARREAARQKRVDTAMYPLLVENRLPGKRIGLVALGGLPQNMIGSVRDSLKDTGARLTTVAVIREPVASSLVPGAAGGNGAFGRFGIDVGAGLVVGGPTINKLARSLFSSSSGQLDGLDAVVLYRSPRDRGAAEEAQVNAFEQGLVTGLTAQNIPVVGVETTDTTPSQIAWYRDRRLTSVDDADELAGQAAIVFTLAGARGAFGVKESAQALLPTTAGGAPAPVAKRPVSRTRTVKRP